jgi:aspartate/methionine/tyrosine aminotransferase
MLINEAGVAVIPLSPFYRAGAGDMRCALCVAKRDDTLTEARRICAHAGARGAQ